MKNSKFLKIICLALVFVFIFSFSVFATDLSVTGRSFGDFLLDNLSINIVSSGSSVDLIKSVTTSDLTNYPNGVRLKVGLYDDTVAIYDYIVNLVLTVPDNIAFSTDWFLGSFDIWLKKDSGYSFIDLYSSYRFSSESGQQNSKYRFLTYDSFPALRITYDTQTRGTHYSTYRVSFSVDLPAGQDTLYFYLGNYDMDTINPDEEILDGLESSTNSIKNSISSSTSSIKSSISSSTSTINSSISDSTSAIKKDNAANTNSILDNQNKTANDIKDNQDKNSKNEIANANTNHNELINGKDYDSVDGTAVNDYADAESQLTNATSQAQSDSISFLNNFGKLFSVSHVHNGLLAYSAIFKEFFAIGWFSEILSFGLGLGAFAFILGTVHLASRFQARSSNKSYSSKKGGDG